MKSRSRRVVPVVSAAALLGGMAAFAVPAHADGTTGAVGVLFGNSPVSGTRTLVLKNADGSAITPLNLTAGQNGFIAEVQDAGISPTLGGFSVTATMSNLYNSADNNCNDFIPSKDVTLTSAPGLLSEYGLSSALQPVFTIQGDLTSLLQTISSLLPGITPNPTPEITNVTTTADSTLNQAAEAAGSTLSTLVGNLLQNLPMGLTSSSGSFQNPAPPPSGSGCTVSDTPTPVTVMGGTLTTNPLLSELQGLLGSKIKTVTDLVSQGYLSASQAASMISSATGIPSGVLNTVVPGSGTVLSQIENALTATVSGLVDAATAITGNYDAGPVLAIAPPANQAAGNYVGVLTLTLTDTGSGD